MLCRDPLVNDDILDRIGHCLKDLLSGSFSQRLTVQIFDIVADAFLEGILVENDIFHK